jgi:hypothetical protein
MIIKHLIHITNEEKAKVAFIRCDKSGGNHDLQNQIKDNHPKLVCQFEFTAPDSPQQNGKVERKIATLYGRVRAMLNEAEFNWPLRHAMWAYASLHATKLDNLLIRPDTYLSPVYMYYGHTPEWAEHLHSFVEIAIVTSTTKVKAKLDYKAKYLRPSVDHKRETYVFWNHKTKHSLEFSAVFLKQNYGTFNKVDNQTLLLKLQQLQMN